MAQYANRSHFRLPIAGCWKHNFGRMRGFSSEAYQAVGFSRDRSTPPHASFGVAFRFHQLHLAIVPKEETRETQFIVHVSSCVVYRLA
jgi:hypothetical protein